MYHRPSGTQWHLTAVLLQVKCRFVTDVSKGHTAHIFRAKKFKKSFCGLLDTLLHPEEQGMPYFETSATFYQ
jgi:hypothetical protein